MKCSVVMSLTMWAQNLVLTVLVTLTVIPPSFLGSNNVIGNNSSTFSSFRGQQQATPTVQTQSLWSPNGSHNSNKLLLLSLNGSNFPTGGESSSSSKSNATTTSILESTSSSSLVNKKPKNQVLNNNQNHGPIISSIRHYRSRKSFTRISPSLSSSSTSKSSLLWSNSKNDLTTQTHQIRQEKSFYQSDQPQEPASTNSRTIRNNRKLQIPIIHYGTEKTSRGRSHIINNKTELAENKTKSQGELIPVKKDNRTTSSNLSSVQKLKKIKNLFLSNETGSQPQLSLNFNSNSKSRALAQSGFQYSDEEDEDEVEEEEISLPFIPGEVPAFEEVNTVYDRNTEYPTQNDEITLSPNGESSSSYEPEIDIVTKFLSLVESAVLNCTPGTEYTLGQGVVGSYAQDRFRLAAEVAVNRANMLTRLWKYARQVMSNEYLLHASLFSMIEFDEDIFAAGNCYDELEYKNYTLFCPFAYRLPEGFIRVKDLAVEYKYMSNTSEFFYAARKNAERVIKNFNQFTKGYNSYTIQLSYNESAHTEVIEEVILNVTYPDGKWSAPYFDCGGGDIWMMTYTVPFFDYKNETYFFKGTSGIDIDLRRVDIDQCPIPLNSTEENIFAGSDKCKNSTTKCTSIKGLGFRRGSYRCDCKDGFYFPNVSSPYKYFNGSQIEEEYEKRLQGKTSKYDELGAFECLQCPYGCDTCIDDRPCVVSLNWLMRSAILILQCVIILMLPIVGLFTWKYSEVKVIRAASPVLLRFIVLGAFFIYCTILVMYPSSSIITCTIRVWLREIGFSLAYGALMLKTWRISVIFRVRSAKAVKITDLDLMKRLGIIVGIFAALLVIRTLVAPPVSIVGRTADDLKAWLCKTDWWDHSFTIMELLLLVWGIRLCIVVRKAPSEFNESKFISLAIYNEFLLSLFLNISMLFLQSPANPDLLYIIFFCHVQLTMTLLLCLIFGSKAYLVFRGHGKGGGSDESRVPTSKFISKQRSGGTIGANSGQPQKNSSINVGNSISGSGGGATGTGGGLNSIVSTIPHGSIAVDHSPNSKTPNDIQDEFRQLYLQLEELKGRNLKLGNRGLVNKIQAMQEAADNIMSSTPVPNTPIIITPATVPLAQQGLISSLLPPSSQINQKENEVAVGLSSTNGSSPQSLGLIQPDSRELKSSEPRDKDKGLVSPTNTNIPRNQLEENEVVSNSNNVLDFQGKTLAKPEVSTFTSNLPGVKGRMFKNEDELEYVDLVGEDDDEEESSRLSALMPLDRVRSGPTVTEIEDEGESTSESRPSETTIIMVGGESKPSESESKELPITSIVPNKSSSSGSKSSNSGGGSGSTKIILDLDDKSRFTEEITV